MLVSRTSARGAEGIRFINGYLSSKMAQPGSVALHPPTTGMWKLGDGVLPKECKLIGWNVNGLRSVLRKGVFDMLVQLRKPEVLCVTETKLDLQAYHEDKLASCLPGYSHYWNFCKVSRGYSGVAVFSKHLPLAVYEDFELLGEQYAGNVVSLEGRLLTLEFEKCYVVNVYKPNSGAQLERLQFKIAFAGLFRRYLEKLSSKKSVVACGDMNVAHQEIDLARPKDNHNNAGFTAPERDSFSVLLKSGFIDCYREQNPGKQEYTWWSNQSQARSKNIGWRIDYFLVDHSLRKNYSQANILSSVMGSDHCPFELTVKF